MASQADEDDIPTQPCQCLSLSYGSLPSDMYLAAKNGDLMKVRQFIENGNDINAADSDGYTLLSSACVGGQKTVVRFLQKQLYLHRNVRDWAGDTPLMHAAMMGHAEVVKELVNCPHMCVLDLNACNNYEESALEVAISAGHADVEQVLKNAKLPKLLAPGDFKAALTPIKAKVPSMVKFECQVCLEEYDLEERRARTLSCGHSVCTSCISGILTNYTNRLNCPFCRTLHTGRVSNAAEIPVNFAIDSVIRDLSS
ncbi:hypothetical protein Pmani_035528 [Petrolisthes manimaculis]|uniref:RING-type domain-containing protein n=1 Tax=Petrolisthes manimaculis TaxID=1843537 RepID=A0AAE1NKN3_9EUCA|nr:hypothetical protein Pmani_035528 [Petrolisthes manimaculis]